MEIFELTTWRDNRHTIILFHIGKDGKIFEAYSSIVSPNNFIILNKPSHVCAGTLGTNTKIGYSKVDIHLIDDELHYFSPDKLLFHYV